MPTDFDDYDTPRYRGSWPDIPAGLVRYLRETFPPKCYEPTSGETLEEHLVYSGQVRLAQAIEAAYVEQVRSMSIPSEDSIEQEIEFGDGEEGERHVLLQRT